MDDRILATIPIFILLISVSIVISFDPSSDGELEAVVIVPLNSDGDPKFSDPINDTNQNRILFNLDLQLKILNPSENTIVYTDDFGCLGDIDLFFQSYDDASYQISLISQCTGEPTTLNFNPGYTIINKPVMIEFSNVQLESLPEGVYEFDDDSEFIDSYEIVTTTIDYDGESFRISEGQFEQSDPASGSGVLTGFILFTILGLVLYIIYQQQKLGEIRDTLDRLTEAEK